jgi:hypothetical protein
VVARRAAEVDFLVREGPLGALPAGPVEEEAAALFCEVDMAMVGAAGERVVQVDVVGGGSAVRR